MGESGYELIGAGPFLGGCLEWFTEMFAPLRGGFHGEIVRETVGYRVELPPVGIYGELFAAVVDSRGIEAQVGGENGAVGCEDVAAGG